MKAKRAPFPLITNPEAKRLPREPSFGNDRESGRCLIALTFDTKGPRRLRRKRIILRNCYRRSNEQVVVENMREYVPKNSTRWTGRQGVALPRLLALGFSVVAGPFMVAEPMHNCLTELPREKFEALWKSHRVEFMDSLEARAFENSAKFPATPTLSMIRLHWQMKGVHENWTADRIRRLCALWKLTPFELAELIQWAPGHMERCLGDGLEKGFRLPGPVAVWFFFLENLRLGLSVFPDFTIQQEAKAS